MGHVLRLVQKLTHPPPNLPLEGRGARLLLSNVLSLLILLRRGIGSMFKPHLVGFFPRLLDHYHDVTVTKT
jgi:hypothetical protein